MAGNLFVLPKQVPIDSGVVVPGAKATFSQTGTSTLQNTFTDILLATPHTNPVVADANGVFAAVYFDPSFVDYRLKLTDANDVLIYQVDDVPASQSGRTLTLNSTAPFIDFIESDGAVNNTVWRLQVNSEQFLFRLANDALSAFTDIAVVDRTANTVDGVAWVGAHTFNTIGTPDVKFKTADKSLNTNITFEDDNHLAGWNLVTGAVYIIEGLILYTQNVGNIQIRFDLSNAEQNAEWQVWATDTSSTQFSDHVSNMTGGIIFITMIDTADASIRITAAFQANASTGGTLDFQWSQQTSSANNTTVKKHSWISLRRIG